MSRGAPSPLQILRHVLGAPGAPRGTGLAVDVGAHTGAFSAELLDSGLFSGVVAFEPNPRNVEPLMVLSSRDARLTVVRSAVGPHEGTAELHCDGNTATGSLLSYDEDYVTEGAVSHLAVTVVALDNYFYAAGAAAAGVRLVKIDTQGHDLAVLRGSGRLLAEARPVVIAELIYVPLYDGQARPEEIIAALHASGHDLHALFNIHATVEGRIAYADALFVPREFQVPVSQSYVQLDNHVSYLTQIATLEAICRERLEVIEVLDAEVKRLRLASGSKP